METTDTTSTRPHSRFALRQRVVFSLFIAMLLMTLGAQVEAFLEETSGVLSLAWPMGMLLLAIYWLRIFLSGWMRRFQIGEGGDESM
ncbi:MAG: hypothetical protein QM739_12810 [Propionivibrio sp.]